MSSQVMILQGIGDVDADGVYLPEPVEAPAAKVINKVTGLAVLAAVLYVAWSQFQPGPGRPGMTIAGFPASTMYALVVDGKVVAKGSAKKMRSLRKKRGGAVWNSPSVRVGERLPRSESYGI